MATVHNVLFLCTGNSARSLLAECALQRWGGSEFRAFSAGSHPKPAPHPMTLQVLESLGYTVAGLRSKSWEEFARPDSPPLHFVFTVCDSARGEPCPIWPGHPMTAHWGCEDPAAFQGPEPEQRRLFLRVYRELEARIQRFTRLPFAELDTEALRSRLEAIGKTPPEAVGGGDA